MSKKGLLCGVVVLSSALFGCSGSDAATGPGGSGDGWQTLVAGDWSLPSGDEGYVCVRTTVKEDVYVRAIRPIAPLGTHHTVLTLEDPSSAPDGVEPCDAGMNGPNMIYGSGLGTEALEFPEGIAIRLRAGDRLMLNLHLFNTGASTLTGMSGIEIQALDAADVAHEAQVTLAGKMEGLLVAPGTTTQTGTCTVPAATTVFAVGAHMHQLGSHLETTLLPAGGKPPVTLFDAAYSFDEQRHQLLATPVAVAPGDEILTACSYENPTSETVKFGDSSEAEMCFSVIFEYPARDRDQYYCVH